MIFNSLQFALFLPVVWTLHWTVTGRARNAVLLVASYVFYGAWDWRFLSLLLISTIVDFTVARRMAVSADPARRKGLLWISVGANLGILGFFKYFNFFVDSARNMLEGIGLSTDPIVLQIVLPVGISFYTFQTMSYTIDVYRRRLEPTDDLLTFAVYVAYFPQLVAGPIELATNLLPQLQRARDRPDGDAVASGLSLILLGLFKKVAIGDVLATRVDDIYSSAGTSSSVALVLATYAFAFQIYADFSGYSDIARGTSRLFGIELIRNFEQPYLSRSITEFWRRWHISLSNWLRDYLYISLGGNRRGTLITYRNLALTMLLGGLWHGASWVFVVWGALHGSFLVAERLIGRRSTAEMPLRLDQVPAIVFTFHLACLAWIFFRAPDLATAVDVLTGILTVRGGSVPLDLLVLVVVLAPVVVAIDVAQRRTGSHVPWFRSSVTGQGVVVGALGAAVVMAAGVSQVPFIYFQF